MRICLICGEIFAWGKYGGFGRATRTIGRELARRGVDVCVVVPRRGDQKPVETLDGMTVYGFTWWNLGSAWRCYRRCKADIYHSQEPSLGTWLARLARPRSRHVITFRDTRDADDWAEELERPSRSRWATWLTRIYEANPLVRYCVRRTEARYCAAHCVGDKAQRVYGLPQRPALLPTPVAVPKTVQKADRPTVCCVSRLDRRKRPELFLSLVPKFPDVQFILIGISQDPEWFESLLAPYRNEANLDYRGFVDQFRSQDVFDTFSRSWVLINTATREGLPNAYLEATAHACAILSFTNPDDFASKYGYHAAQDNFEEGLRYLLEADRWRAPGLAGQKYVRAHYETERSIEQHLNVYARVLRDDPAK